MNKDDICPVSESLDFFNRKWVLCILMDMFRGKKHFTEFQEANPNLSNHVLSQTLKYMEENGLDRISEKGDWKRFPPLEITANPDAGLITQDITADWFDENLPGYRDI